MNKIKFLLAAGAICSLLGLPSNTNAQTPTDGIMMKQRESCFALIYDHGTFNQYWEGTNLRENQTIATVTRTTVLPMIAIGILDRLNLIISTPYIKTESSEPNGGKFAGARGFQDLGFALKAEAVNRQVGKGKLSALATLGYSTPMTNYLSDYMPYSLGFGANEFNARGIVQYRMDNGIYVRATVAHLWRGQTKAERDYYYNNGSYYTPWMDVPNAWNFGGVAGVWFLENSLRVEASYNALASSSGDDIRKYNAAQPTNKVEFGQMGFTSQYFFKKIKGLGALAYYNQMVSGRNAPKLGNLGLGITYQFKL